jgi:tripartite-type tricarboxylate transporter receptor subunit TctC
MICPIRAALALFTAIVLASWWPLAAHAAAADSVANYPDKPIRLIVPAGPGSANDTLARILALRLGDALGRQIVVDNRAGASGIIAAETVAHAAPDGYTLLNVSAATVVIFPQLHKNLSYDPLQDLIPITLFGITHNAMVVHPSLPARSVKDLIALAKSQPGKLNMASAGAGTQSHLAGIQFLVLAGIDAVHVPYKDGGASVASVMANEAQFVISPLPAVLPHVRSGRLRALGTGGDKRSKQLPDVPTISEAGLPGYQSTGWSGLQGPTGIPRTILDKLNATLAKVMNQPDTREQIERQGAEPVTSTPAEFASFIREEWDRFGPAIKAAGLKVE